MSHFLHEAPARLGLTKVWRTFHHRTVPVLLLHGVLPDADARPFNSTGKFISPRKLQEFLERISRRFKVIAMETFVKNLHSQAKFDNQMLITFDDGYHNTYEHAFPLLRRMGLPFAVFVTTGFTDSRAALWSDKVEFALFSTAKKALPLGVLPCEQSLEGPENRHEAAMLLKETLKSKSLDEADRLVASVFEQLEVDPDDAGLSAVRFLGSTEIREMAAAGVAFGGHSVTHPILSRESAERIRVEIRQCKKTLEEITQEPITCFAYPNGRREDFNEAVKHELAEAGYAAAFTTMHGLYAPGDDPFEIRRIAVDGRWTYSELETRASGVLKILHLRSTAHRKQ